MKSLKLYLLASALVIPASLAHAQATQGVYIGAGLGVNLGTSAHQGVRLETDPGFLGLMSVGYGFSNGIRTELEGGYRNNKFENMKIGNMNSNSARGNFQTFSLMGNAYYDFNNSSRWTPYVGAGLGYAWFNDNNLRADFGPTSLNLRERNDGSFAYQAMAGVSYRTNITGLQAGLEYRYFGTDNRRYDMATANNPNFARGNLPMDSHSVLLGIRYAFNDAPRAAPQPMNVAVAPSAPVARTYLVFFDWNKADLTERAKSIVSEASTAARSQNVRVEINGHTDTSGSPEYNKRLSMRRAETVRSAMVSHGVSSSAISVYGHGETNPLIQGANMREPQNRRVEIVIK